MTSAPDKLLLKMLLESAGIGAIVGEAMSAGAAPEAIERIIDLCGLPHPEVWRADVASPPWQEFRPEHWKIIKGRNVFRAWLDLPPLSPEELRRFRLEPEIEKERDRRAVKRAVDALERPAVEIPEILALDQRLARPMPELIWRIDGWMPADARIVLAAQFKAGKTTLVQNLIRSLIDGELRALEED